MFVYSKSTLFDTLDLVKKILFILDLFIQVFYIGYLSFRIFTQSGMLIFNIILTAISSLYLIYYLINIREFYTKKHLRQKKVIASCVRISKRIINIVVIAIAVINLSSNQGIDSLNILFTLLLIVGFIVAVFADIIVALIDQRKKLFVNAMFQDIEDFKEDCKVPIAIARTLLKFQEFKEPLNVDAKQLDKLHEIKHKYEQKERRKDDFFHKKEQP